MAQQNKDTFMVHLRTDDNQIISVDCEIASRITNICDDIEMSALNKEKDAIIIPIKNVEASILKIIIKWLTLKAEADEEHEHGLNDQFDGMKALRSVLPQNFDRSTLLRLMKATHTLKMGSLLDVCSIYMAEILSGGETI